MASSGVAAADIERGNDLTMEANGLRLCEILDFKSQACRPAAGFHDQSGLTILQRSEEPIDIGGDDTCRLGSEGGEWRQIALAAVRVLSGYDHLLHGSRPGRVSGPTARSTLGVAHGRRASRAFLRQRGVPGEPTRAREECAA